MNRPDASCYICIKFNVCLLARTIDDNVGVFFDVDRAEQAQVYHVIGLRCKHFETKEKTP